jgi:hypothetical protein
MTYTFDEKIVSDLHKDARGYRPSSYWLEDWHSSCDEIKQTIWDNLIAELNAEMERQRHADSMAIIEFHQRVQGLMVTGAKDEIQALKWIIQGEWFDKFDLMYGADYFCFNLGLPYAAKDEFPIQEAINEVLASLEESV